MPIYQNLMKIILYTSQMFQLGHFPSSLNKHENNNMADIKSLEHPTLKVLFAYF